MIPEIMDFLHTARGKDAYSVKIKRSKDVVKLRVCCRKYIKVCRRKYVKVRRRKYAYTLCVSNSKKADMLKQLLPRGLTVQDETGSVAC